MAQLKAHEFEQALKRGLSSYAIFLFYGPDSGLVSERAEMLATATGIDADDPFSSVRLDAQMLQSDPGRLADEAASIGLFGDRRLIRVTGAGNDKALTGAVDRLAAEPPAGCTIIIEAGDLKKGASLRSAVEKSKGALAIPCYADEARAINALIDEEMLAADLRITVAARQHLPEMLGGDRRASRAELKKLTLYCRGNETVDEADVIAINGDAAALSIDDAVDALLTGDIGSLEKGLQRVVSSKTSVFLVLQSALRLFQRLDGMRASMEADGKTAAQLVGSPAARIHFKRKPAIESGLRNWSAIELGRALRHLQEAVLKSRQYPALEDAVARQALLALALRSARRRT